MSEPVKCAKCVKCGVVPQIMRVLDSDGDTLGYNIGCVEHADSFSIEGTDLEIIIPAWNRLNTPAVDWKSVHAKLAKEYEDRIHVRPEFATLTADWIVEFVRQQIEGGAK